MSHAGAMLRHAGGGPGPGRVLAILAVAFCGATALSALAGLIQPGSVFSRGPVLTVLNTALPLTILAASVGFALALMHHDRILIWTPIVMIFAHVAVFQGLGPLVHVFGNEATQTALDYGALKLSSYDLLRTHVLNLTSTASILLGMLLAISHRGLARGRTAPAGAAFRPERVALVFLFSGLVLRFGLILPANFGLLEFTVPGAIMKLSPMVDLGFALIAYIAVKNKGGWPLLFWCLYPPHLGSIFLEFDKSNMMIAMMLPAMAGYLAHGGIGRLAVWCAAMALTYSAMQPFVLFSRQMIRAEHGSIDAASLSERANVVATVLGNIDRYRKVVDVRAVDEQLGWMRLSYAGPQAYVMRAYDQGQVNDTTALIWYTWVPRILWPDKPHMSNASLNFYRQVTNRVYGDSRIGITVQADAYWNFGWPGVIGLGIFVGLLLGMMSRLSMHFLRTEQLLYYPVVFLAMEFSILRLTGWMVEGVFGQMPIYFAYLLLIWGLAKFFSNSQSGPARGMGMVAGVVSPPGDGPRTRAGPPLGWAAPGGARP